MKKLSRKWFILTIAVSLLLPSGFAVGADRFPDVNPNTVTPEVQEAIVSLAAQGIINGFQDGTFGPNKSITWAQFAKILAQVKGLEPNPAAAEQFADIIDLEQKGWIETLVAVGLTTGTSETTYSPNQPIQREQAATFIVRALGLEEVAKELNLKLATTDGERIHVSHRRMSACWRKSD